MKILVGALAICAVVGLEIVVVDYLNRRNKRKFGTCTK